jgi:two-component system sensor histidine kinase FlrB
MPKLPTARQNPLHAKRIADHAVERKSLAHAFRTFTQAAGSLEKSYAQLQGEVGRLRGELASANAELSRSVEENTRGRVFLTRILAGLPCGVVVTDSHGQPRMVNPEARRLLNLDAQWMPDRGTECSPALSVLLSAATPGSSSCEQEWICDSPLCNRTIGISGAKVEESAGDETETIWILRDISDQKRIAAERETARRALALAEIATVLAHEIRNPLASMELFTGLLAGATSQMPEAGEWVTHLQAGLRSLAATVNNVLQFHSQPCGELISTNVDRLLRETADFLGPLARQRGVEIAIRNPIGRVMVAADAHRLQQVFFNLALNAFQAMKHGGALNIQIQWAGDCPGSIVQIDFEDEGNGIEASRLEQIFEPGFTTKAGSPGLGLSVCKKVIEQHKGSICAESHQQIGTTFSIFLPVSGGTE